MLLDEAVDSGLTTCSKKSGKPSLALLNDRRLDPHHTVLWMDIDKPRWKKSKADGNKPGQAIDRSGGNRSVWMKSDVDSIRPRHALPNTESVSPAHPVGKYKSFCTSEIEPKQTRHLGNIVRPE